MFIKKQIQLNVQHILLIVYIKKTKRIRLHGGVFLPSQTKRNNLLNAINRDFLSLYAQTASTILDKNQINTVMVYKDAKLSVWMKKNADYLLVEEIKLIEPHDEYTYLKGMAHTSLYIQTQIMRLLANDESLLETQNKLHHLLKTLIDLHTCPSEYPNKHCDEILIKSIRFVKIILQMDSIDKLQIMFLDYIDSLKKPLAENNKHAARIQLHRLHHVMQELIAKHTIDLENSRLIVVGGHNPRINMIESQYFSCMYSKNLGIDDPTNDKLYYLEVMPDHARTLDIKKDVIEKFLASSEMNKEYGRTRLDDKKGMFVDVLGKYAQEYLAEIYDEKDGGKILHRV